MINFLANENFPLKSIKLLRTTGYKVISILEENPGEKDEEILKKANKEKLIILTFDRDYGELIYHYKFPVPGGVIYFRFEPETPEEPGKILLSLLKKKIELFHKFTILDKKTIRQRALKE